MIKTILILAALIPLTGCKPPPKAPNLLRQAGDKPGSSSDQDEEANPKDLDSIEDAKDELDAIGKEITEAGIVPTVEALELKKMDDESAFVPLSHSQLENALHVVFEIPMTEPLIQTNLPPFASLTLFDNDSSAMILNYDFLQPYQQVANGLIDKLVTKSNRYQALIPQSAPKAPGLERAQAIIAPLLKKAYQGQETAQDTTALATAFVAAKEAYPADDFDKAGMRSLIPAIIFSPKFIYRSQIGSMSEANRVALSSKELVGRLAASLWNTIPNTKLLADAANLDVTKADSIDAFVKTMASDSRFDEQLLRFNIFAFKANSVHLMNRTDAQWTDKNKNLIRQETEAFFAHMVKENKGLTEILTAPYAFVSEASASLYGVKSPGAQVVKTDLDPTRRRGFYSQVGFLAFNSDALGNLTIRRGSNIVTSLVCTSALKGERAEPKPVQPDKKITRRQAVSLGTDGCGGLCHKPLMNPIGFAFEVFNKDGAWQDKDNGLPVDAKDLVYLSKDRKIEFDGAAQFSEKLSTMFETHRCYASKVVQYVFGRNPSLAENELIDLLASASLKGMSTKELFIKAVGSSAYRQRSGN